MKDPLVNLGSGGYFYFNYKVLPYTIVCLQRPEGHGCNRFAIMISAFIGL